MLALLNSREMEPRRYTFLHSDIADSSPSWEKDSARMAGLVDQIFSVIREATELHNGRVYKSLGDGLACVFGASADAVKAAIEMLRRLGGDRTRLRIGIHCGEAVEVEMDYMGACLNRVSRITNAGHADQILISEEAWQEAAPCLETSVNALDLGFHLTKGHQVAESIYQIQAEHLRPGFPPLRNVVALSVLPRPLTQVVGREADLTIIEKLVSDRSNRLLTILGFGGVGKTTIAMELAQSLREKGLGRIWWVECENVTSPEQLWQEMRLALGVNDPNFDPIIDLAGLTHHAEVVLVLDCFERMASQGSALLRLLQACPMLQIVLTSRIALDLPEERIYPLRGLIDLSKKRPSTTHAAALFVQTAERVDPQFAPNRRERSVISEIVRLVEGIPLAILLAAGRTSSMSVAQLRDRLSESILQTVRRTTLAEGRHANLRTVIDASFSLLGDEQRVGLAESSVFRGGFTARAARAVLGHSDPEGLLGGLQGNSLVAASDIRGNYRFRVLDSVIEFLDEVGDRKVVLSAQRRHIEFYRKELQGFKDQIAQDEWREVGRFLEDERGNLAQAVRVLPTLADDELLCTFADVALLPLFERGYLHEFEELAHAAQSRHETVGDDIRLERVLGLLTVHARRRESWSDAQTFAAQRAKVAQRFGRTDLVVQSAAESLSAATESEDVGAIRESWRRFVEARKLAPEDLETRVSYNALEALSAAWCGDGESAQRLIESVEEEMLQADLPSRSTFFPLVMLGRTHVRLGHWEDAQAEFLELLVRANAEQLPHPTSLAAFGLVLAGEGQAWRDDATRVLLALPKREAPRVAGFLHRLALMGVAIPRPSADRHWVDCTQDLLNSFGQ